MTEKTPSRPVVIGIAIGLVVVAVVAAVVLSVLLYRRAATERAGNEALATARAYAVTVTTYDFQNLDRDFANVLDGATGDFKDQYAGASQTLRPLIVQAKATGRGTVLDAAIKSVSTDQVEVLLFTDVQITGGDGAPPRTERDRMSMTMTRVDDRWLVSKMEVS